MKELIKVTRDDLYKDRLCVIQGSDYKSGDIRTYKVAPLASNPATDIMIHESLSPSAESQGSHMLSTNLGTILSGVHSLSYQKAVDKVLHFPSAKEINGLVFIQSIKMNTPMPLWMINRYGLTALKDKVDHDQSTNIYYDKKHGQFVVLFDESFLDKVSYSDIKCLLSDECIRSVRIYGKSSGGEALGVLASTVDEIKSTDSAFSKTKKAIIDAYFSLLVSGSSSRKVICITALSPKNFGTNDSFVAKNKLGNALYALLDEGGVDLQITYVVALERSGILYPVMKDGNVNTKEPFTFNQRHLRQHADKGFENSAHLMIDYSDEDLAFIEDIISRLRALKSDLLKFFKSAESQDNSKLDVSPRSIAWSFPLGIEQKNDA